MNQYALLPRDANDLTSRITQFLNYMGSKSTEPFSLGDTTAGMEYELQVAVEGDYKSVDLASTIRSSTYYKNIVKRTEQGDLSPTCIESLNNFIYNNSSNIWENSWVRFPKHFLSSWTRKLLNQDFLSDKSVKGSKQRSDIHRFRTIEKGKEYLRIPISYLLKLALANSISEMSSTPLPIFETGLKLLQNFLSDNTSPEILSFTVQDSKNGPIGDLAAKETARTYLLVQLLAQYANNNFGLTESNQKCLIYCAPHAPTNQKILNDIVPDGVYRHLFISPCLSGWDKGENKNRYMEKCHKILSRSQLNTVTKLKDSGIIVNNLIIIPNTSNTCLANNGTHVSLGSKLLTSLATEQETPYQPAIEKYFGDLAIKIIEHFLPLMVNTYSAAPYKLDFADFHPEKVLGFLPHELDYTHLRMIWRRWKKKAKINFLGRTFTPYGPRWLDNKMSQILRLKGDLVPDFRLIDYLVTLLSTETSPALNGEIGNHQKLQKELAEMGVFDPEMSIYLLYRQRSFHDSGFSGFEGRSYSLFHSLTEDLKQAVDLQNLITALSYRYILTKNVQHVDIPDNPFIESERRQIFFATAIDLPTVYIKYKSGNRFLQKVLTLVTQKRNSRRYKGYIRVKVRDYQQALIKLLKTDGADLIEQFGMEKQIESLSNQMTQKKPSVSSEIIEKVTDRLPLNQSPLNVSANTFNKTAEEYYRTTLKTNHLKECLSTFLLDLTKLEKRNDPLLEIVRELFSIQTDLSELILKNKDRIIAEETPPELLLQLIFISLTIIHHEQTQNGL